MRVAISSPMPGLVVAVHVAAGDRVAAGDPVAVVETMKFQSTVRAPESGRIAAVARAGDLMMAGDAVAQLEPAAVRPVLHSPAQVLGIALGDSDATFHEWDLADGCPPAGLSAHERSADFLVPVHRELGEQEAGIVVGLITHRFPGHHGPTRRVWLCGDPSRMMGAVAEAECRRILAALDFAEAHGLPVEWVAVSGGAQISMESGTENMDWCAAVVRRVIEFAERGGEINVIVAGINVGAQSYWNAMGTMLGHCTGVLIMVDGSAMVLTGNRALAMSGGHSSPRDTDLGGFAEIMGRNGEAHHRAADLAEAYGILLAHLELHGHTAATRRTFDPRDRDLAADPEVAQALEAASNPARNLPFPVRTIMERLADTDAARLELWTHHVGADGVVAWETALGGQPVTLIGCESQPRESGGSWQAAGTLYPRASKKMSRAIRRASGRRPVVVLANLAGFDGSAESMLGNQLEWGSEIARAVVNFRGPIVVLIIGRFHGGAYVVFNKTLNPNLTMLALEGTRVSVIGGSAAAEVVLGKEVKRRLEGTEAPNPEEARLRARAEVAAQFDAVHSVERARQTGSVDEIISVKQMRPRLIEAVTAREAAAAPAMRRAISARG